MNIDPVAIITAISTAGLSGLVASLIAYKKDIKKEKDRKSERNQDILKLELKDLQITLYKLERELNEWKEKYYETIQELIDVKCELEQTLIKLTTIKEKHELD